MIKAYRWRKLLNAFQNCLVLRLKLFFIEKSERVKLGSIVFNRVNSRENTNLCMLAF